MNRFIVPLLLAFLPASLAAQEGEPADTSAASSEQVDVGMDADSVAPPAFPLFARPPARSPEIARRWSFAELKMIPALDLGGYLEFGPWMTPVRAGFLEGPGTFVFAGSGSPSLQYSIDGYEFVPLGSGYLDTHQLSVVEVEQLDLLREPGGYRLSSRSYRRSRSDAYSRVEGGTGDRSTNIIRAALATEIFGGPWGFGFDRLDTRGSDENGSMERTTIWGKISYPLMAGIWGQFEYRRTVMGRDSLAAPDRTDIVFRFRAPLGSGWSADLIGGRASETITPAGAEDLPDSLVTKPSFAATQLAARVGRESEHWGLSASVRALGGDGVPDFLNEASVRVDLGPLGILGRGRWESWSDFIASSGYAILRLALPARLSASLEAEDGARGLWGVQPAASREFFTRVTAGAGFRSGLWDLLVRGGRWRVDPSTGLGAPFDSAAVVGGGTVTVFEARGRMPLFRLFKGQVSAGGFYQIREAGAFLYWPKDQWYVEGRYHLQPVKGQLDILFTGQGGVRGAMLVQDANAGPGFFFPNEDLNWFRGEVVIRVKDVHIFWDFTGYNSLTGLPSDIPGFPFPTSRSHFGLKWEFWN